MKMLLSLIALTLYSHGALASQNVVLHCATHTGGRCSNGGGCSTSESHLKLILSDLKGTADMDNEDFIVRATESRGGLLSFTGVTTNEFSSLTEISGSVDLQARPIELNLNYVYRGTIGQNSYSCSR